MPKLMLCIARRTHLILVKMHKRGTTPLISMRSLANTSTYTCARIDPNFYSEANYPLDPPRPSLSDNTDSGGNVSASLGKVNALASASGTDNNLKSCVLTAKRKDLWHDTRCIKFMNLYCLRTSLYRSTVLHEGLRTFASCCHADEDINAQRLAIPSPATVSLQRLNDVVEVMDAIRLVVMCATIPAHLHSMACVSAQMPVWWQESHTLCLLKGVCKHGWREWEKIIYDSNLEWAVPSNYQEVLKVQESEHLQALYGQPYFEKSVTSTNKSHAPKSEYSELDIDDFLASVSMPNKPVSLLLQSLSPEQLETVSRTTALNYVEALLSWSASVPPPQSIISSMKIEGVMPPPSPVEIVYFYIKHERFPKHTDRHKVKKMV